MRLHYRGNGYEYEPVDLNTVESEINGRYRWQGFNFSYPRHIPVPQADYNSLTYRGVDYPTEEARELSPTCFRPHPAVSVNTAVRNNLNARRAMMREVEQMHLKNIQDRLVRRIEAARARGDRSLVQQLEAEMSYMTCPI
ncbi:MAG: DUF4278 domain-containing protein [Cyanobacteria bacterium J06638_20]